MKIENKDLEENKENQSQVSGTESLIPSPGSESPVPSPEIAISVRNLSKKYHLYASPKHRLKEALNPFRKKYHRDFWALRDVSFEVKRGETIGIIGKNGSGKSTLLQIICGILQPSEGEVNVNGKISALLELGAGFNPEFTGRDNVFLKGAIMGFSRDEMDTRFQAIADFADIGEFIDQPVKTYSSGMFVRLAFAAAINVDPEILIVDEALSVGDMFFQAKCMMRIKKMIDSGVTLFFVSHDVGAIKSLCEKALLLSKGLIIDYDKADKVVEEYFALKVRGEQQVIKRSAEDGTAGSETGQIATPESKMASFIHNLDFQKRAAFQRIQNGKANFINVQLIDKSGHDIITVEYGQRIVIRMAVEICDNIGLLAYGYHIRDKNGINLIYSDSSIEGKNLIDPRQGDKYVIDWSFVSALQQGDYSIACFLSVPIDIMSGVVEFCDFVPIACQFSQLLRKTSPLYGKLHIENDLTILKR
jgi:lipopolysaccharide transport system ATP-binding protein